MTRLLLCAAVLLATGAPLAAADDKGDSQALAKTVLDALVKEDFGAAYKHLGEEAKKQLPEDKLKDAWKMVREQFGAFKSVVSTNFEKQGLDDIITLTCQFEKGPLDVRITVSGTEVHGLFFTPNAKLAYKPPDYVKEGAFREIDVTISPGDWELPGTLTLPAKGEGPFPAVILVHGSGPHDRDESVGRHLPFRDLAWGLACKGVAVLRYEKRTKQYGYRIVKQNIPVTIKEEVLDDVAAAAALLRARKDIDAKKIFVLGHSLGGHLAPKIAQRDDKLAGLILLAGNSRPLPTLVAEQVDYLLSLSDKPSDEEKKQVEEIKKQVERIKDPKLADSKAQTEQILGAPISYWLSLRDYDAPAAAAKVKAPLLVLQGERDYQVTMTDFDGWKKALKDRKDVTFKSYPALNHLFVVGEGKSKPAEYYESVGHVSATVIDDIAEWIKKK
jgi:dienelactone hydrolase